MGNIPEDVVRDMADVAPMLSVLGYDPFANPPDYGKPDAWVEDNTSKVCAAYIIFNNFCLCSCSFHTVFLVIVVLLCYTSTYLLLFCVFCSKLPFYPTVYFIVLYVFV